VRALHPARRVAAVGCVTTAVDLRGGIRRGLDDLGRRGWLAEIAIGVAVGWAALGFVEAIVQAIVTFATTEVPDDDYGLGFVESWERLTVVVFGHALYLLGVVTSGLTLAAALVAGVAVVRRLPADEPADA
jgi:hypothetical protein